MSGVVSRGRRYGSIDRGGRRAGGGGRDVLLGAQTFFYHGSIYHGREKGHFQSGLEAALPAPPSFFLLLAFFLLFLENLRLVQIIHNFYFMYKKY